MLLIDLAYIYIYIYIYSLNTLFGGKSCLVAPGVAVPPWASETVLSALVSGWWEQVITRDFTRRMMKKYIYILQSIFTVFSVRLSMYLIWSDEDNILVFNWNHFEMRLLNLRINFYLLWTFCPHLSSFWVVSSFTTFRPNFTSGLLQVIYRDLG